jgi:hypothetical protein
LINLQELIFFRQELVGIWVEKLYLPVILLLKVFVFAIFNDGLPILLLLLVVHRLLVIGVSTIRESGDNLLVDVAVEEDWELVTKSTRLRFVAGVLTVKIH